MGCTSFSLGSVKSRAGEVGKCGPRVSRAQGSGRGVLGMRTEFRRTRWPHIGRLSAPV